MKAKRILINDPTYQFRWWIQKGGTPEEAIAYVNTKEKLVTKFSFPVNVNRKGVFCSCDELRGGVIWYRKDAGVCSIVHEATHAACYVFRKMDCVLDENNEEFFTYYVDALVGNIVSSLWK